MWDPVGNRGVEVEINVHDLPLSWRLWGGETLGVFVPAGGPAPHPIELGLPPVAFWRLLLRDTGFGLPSSVLVGQRCPPPIPVSLGLPFLDIGVIVMFRQSCVE